MNKNGRIPTETDSNGQKWIDTDKTDRNRQKGRETDKKINKWSKADRDGQKQT